MQRGPELFGQCFSPAQQVPQGTHVSSGQRNLSRLQGGCGGFGFFLPWPFFPLRLPSA
jgi:hypothetical protein